MSWKNMSRPAEKQTCCIPPRSRWIFIAPISAAWRTRCPKRPRLEGSAGDETRRARQPVREKPIVGILAHARAVARCGSAISLEMGTAARRPAQGERDHRYRPGGAPRHPAGEPAPADPIDL